MECYVRKHDKLVRHLDMCIEEVSREYARVTMPITENHKNGMGVAHGGAIFSLADVAFGCAANAGNDHGVVSLSTTIEYLRPGVVSPSRPKPVWCATAPTCSPTTSTSMTAAAPMWPSVWPPVSRPTCPCPLTRAKKSFSLRVLYRQGALLPARQQANKKGTASCRPLSLWSS